MSLGVATKLNPDWEFLQHLKAVGRTCAQDWLTHHFDKVGKLSGIDVAATFLRCVRVVALTIEQTNSAACGFNEGPDRRRR